MKRLSVGIIGLGYWGPNWLRNFSALEDCTLAYGCDLRKERTLKFARLYPATKFTQRVQDLLNDRSLDAIVIASPTSTHFDLAKRALKAGKHVLIEKPMTSSPAEAARLVALAKKMRRKLLVDHTFAYTPSVRKMAELAGSGALGGLLYFDSTRINLGLIQPDCNVFWDLAIHDLTILAAVADLTKVTEVYAVGSRHFTKQIEDGHLHLTFQGGLAAHIHVSWLSPVKIRQTILAGRRAMVLYNDTQPSEKIRIYDRGVDRDHERPDPFFPKYRSGNILIPAMPLTEALATEAQHFLQCIRGEEKPLVSGEDGLEVIKILTAADESLKKNRPVKITAD
ncbi:MAG: Gfo/Idh/MocA family oxidoreductase [Candidatus Peribacteraceae bacterium]